MKKMQMLGIGMLTVAAIAANAQSLATSDDGIAASPKVRQRIEERRATFQVESTATGKTSTTQASSDGIAASPKVRTQLDARYAAARTVSSPSSFAASTTRPASDGIAASPKFREQLDERALRSHIEVAPIIPAK